MNSQFRRTLRSLTACIWPLWIIASALLLLTQDGTADDAFETSIRPLLLDRCVECHGPTKQENGIRLDRRQDVLQGKAGDRALIVPGAPADSRLWQVLQHSADDIAMPSSGKLDDLQLTAVKNWIEAGAPWPETSSLEAEARRRAEKWREHWAFQPVQTVDLSACPEGRHPIDFLIDRQLAEQGLQRSPTAPAAVLVRRLSFALLGLPPESRDLQEAQAAFDRGEFPQWYTALVDRWLGSPHFGERWGRYWLDVSRYADTKGYVFNENREYPDAWKYREWVIRALNADMPWDEFLKRQLSADRMPGSDDPGQLAAMGFLTLGRRFLNNPHDIIDDRIDVVTRGMLGLTVACARCHDHKFDPIPTADYYSMYGIFASSDEPKNEPSTLRLVDKPQPEEPVIFRRGNPGNRGDPVPRRFLTAISASDAANFSNGSGRLELANSIASRDNPLTGRVAVNRVWMHLFGRGFVETPSDFGVRTEQPSHLELLDWLTKDFQDHGWSLKHLIRQIVLSETWRQSSDHRDDLLERDPENRLFARMNRMRLDFESQRDAVLCAAGQLDRTVGGPSADLAADANVRRRAVYARIDRQNVPGLFRTFDMASPDTHTPRRFQTTIPQQALFYLNNAFLMNRASEVAALTHTADADQQPADRIRQMFRIVLQREPGEEELRAAESYVSDIQQLQTTAPGGWSYGYGRLDDGATTVTDFRTLTVVKEGRIQGGEMLPDAALGWVFLNRTGGHAGNDLHQCAIRRWTADAACRVLLHGVVTHETDQGDGVRMRVLAPRGQQVADVVAANSTQTFAGAGIELAAGDTLDFVVDCRSGSAHDSFKSKVVITQSGPGNAVRVWNSDQDFREQVEGRQDAWSQLAQALLMTNEFAFVD
ncbi:MAG: hypothetical protein RLZZ232_1226 [Planctomycetota bacterium]|jgi:hypothetical protein